MILNTIDGKLQINIIRRSNPAADNHWDSNWLDAEVEIISKGFSARYFTYFRTEDFQSFHDNLQAFLANKVKDFMFATIEEGLALNYKIDSLGKISCKGQTKDEYGNVLFFIHHIEYQALTSFFNQLKKIVSVYPSN